MSIADRVARRYVEKQAAKYDFQQEYLLKARKLLEGLGPIGERTLKKCASLLKRHGFEVDLRKSSLDPEIRSPWDIKYEGTLFFKDTRDLRRSQAEVEEILEDTLDLYLSARREGDGWKAGFGNY